MNWVMARVLGEMSNDQSLHGSIYNRVLDHVGHFVWEQKMTDWREELIEKMGKAFINALMFDDGIRAALAVAEPVIREECIKIVELNTREIDYIKIAAAIREGGKDE